MKWRIVYKEINRLAAEKVLEQQEVYTFEEAWTILHGLFTKDSTWNFIKRKDLEFVLRNDVLKVVVAHRNQEMITIEKVLPQQNQVPNPPPRL